MKTERRKEYGIKNSIKQVEKNMTWLEFNTKISQIHKKILKSGYKPSIIVAISRGGWIPSWFLSELLDIQMMASIGLKYIDSKRKNLETYSVPVPICSEWNVLLVEEILATGKSLLKAKEILAQKVTNVKTVSLYYVKESQIIPDFSCGLVDHWVVLPWEDDCIKLFSNNPCITKL